MSVAEPPSVSGELFDRLGDAVMVIDGNWIYSYVSPGTARIFGRPVEDVLGRRVWDLFPELVGTPQYDALVRAMSQRSSERFVWYADAVDRWYEQQAIPVDDGLVLVANDVTDREAVVRRSGHLLAIGESLAGTLTVDDVAQVVREHALPLVGAGAGSIVLIDEARGLAVSLGWVGMDPEVTEGMREYPLDPAAPSVDAYRTGQPVTVAGLDEFARRYPHLVDFVRRIDKRSIAAFPLTVADERLGALVLLFDSEQAFHVVDRELIATIAAMTAQALARSRLYDEAKRNMSALQRSLLPLELPVIDGLDIAVRYAASESTVDVGGDWFDVIRLRAGAVGIVMGDVEGHDLAAAALMGLLRSAIRAYAIEEHPPAVIMRGANEFLVGLGASRIATVSYSHVHPKEHLITTVSAGHLPAMITSPGNAVHDVPAEIGPPLGVMSGGLLWPESTSTLPPNALLALFTDGLVEMRTDDISVGLERVRTTLGGMESMAVESIADALLAARQPSGDDVALVIARVMVDADADRVITRRLPPTPASVSLARRFVRQLLAEWTVGVVTAGDVELALSEIITNAARHSEDTLDLTLSCTPDCVRFAVSDSSHRMPPDAAPVVDDDATAGRGLHLVDAVASRWGIASDGLGKTVWCEFDR